VTVTKFQTSWVYEISSKSSRYGNFTIFNMADNCHLNFRGTVIGSLKSPCRTSYWSSIETVAVNCLVFDKIAFLRCRWRQRERFTLRYCPSVCLFVRLSVTKMRKKTSVSETIRKLPLVEAQNAVGKTKEIWRTTIFNMAIVRHL